MRNGRPGQLAQLALLALVVTLGVTAASCSAGPDDRASSQIEGLGSSLQEIRRLARAEGSLELVAPPGYVAEAWAGPFERQTGCAVTATEAAASDDLLSRFRAGEYDGIAVPGDVGGLLMAGGDVAPVDPGLIPNYEQVEEGVKNLSGNSRDGQPYGVPFSRAPNLLAYRSDAVTEDPTSWEVIWEGARRFTGRLSIHDDPIVIADAAVYLRATRLELGIDDPYQLDEEQFEAALELLRRQARHVGEYWRPGEATQVASFRNGESAIGTSNPAGVRAMADQGVPVRARKPVEGTTGRSDTWMVSTNARRPNCTYLWLDYVISPVVQAWTAEALEQAPVNLAACDLTRDPQHCAALHADDERWWDDVSYRATPAEDCGDPSSGETCKTFAEWKAAWADLRG